MTHIKTAEERLSKTYTQKEFIGAQVCEIEELRAALEQAQKKIAELEEQIGWINIQIDDDVMYETIMAKAKQSYLRHKYSVRGQIITRYDDFETHLIHAAFAWKEAQTPAQPTLEDQQAYSRETGNAFIHVPAQPIEPHQICLLTDAILKIAQKTEIARQDIIAINGSLALLLAENVLEYLSAQPEQEPVAWISVEDRLPEVKAESCGFFLVTAVNLQTQKKSVFEAAFLNEMELYSDDHDPKPFSGWHSAKESKDYDGWYEPLGNDYCKVTHWMPLPPPATQGE